jgi:hypothetical protein
MNRRTALGGRGVTGPWFTSRGVDARDVSRREPIGSPDRAESLADLGSSARWRRTMALQHSTLGTRVASNQDLVRALLIVAAVIVLMLVLTVVFGVQQTGPSYQIVPDPASGLGVPF